MLGSQSMETSDRESLKLMFGNSNKNLIGQKADYCCMIRQFFQIFISNDLRERLGKKAFSQLGVALSGCLKYIGENKSRKQDSD